MLNPSIIESTLQDKLEEPALPKNDNCVSDIIQVKQRPRAFLPFSAYLDDSPNKLKKRMSTGV